MGEADVTKAEYVQTDGWAVRVEEGMFFCDLTELVYLDLTSAWFEAGGEITLHELCWTEEFVTSAIKCEIISKFFLCF